MPRPIQVRIDLAALRHNYLITKELVANQGGAPKAWAVVKADAYGHGLMRAVRALGDVADGFALLELDAAVALRDAGVRQPILLLEGFFERDDLDVCAQYGLISCIHRIEQLQMIREAKLPTRLPVYLKFNTGMNRLGFTPDQLPALKRELAISTAIGQTTLMTHFAEADGERGVDWQLERFAEMSKGGIARFRWQIQVPSCVIRRRRTTGSGRESCSTVAVRLLMQQRQATASSR